MSEASVQLFRFACPHCKKVLKAPLEWSGKRGVCSSCQKTVQFPVFKVPSAKSRTAEQLLKVVSENDDVTLEEATSDQLAMLLSLGTCGDYLKASKILVNRPLSARQWRRILNSAAARENMRLHIEEQLDKLAVIPDDEEDPAALVAAAEATNPDAWKVIARYLYLLRHGACERCQLDPTGLTCLYLTWEQFTRARLIPNERAKNWELIFQHHLGL